MGNEKKELFTYKTQYGEYPNCSFVGGRYMNGNLAIRMISDEEGPIATCTVNMGVRVPWPLVCIKGWSENQGMDEFLIQEGIVNGDVVDEIAGPHVTAKVYCLTEKGKEIFKDFADME